MYIEKQMAKTKQYRWDSECSKAKGRKARRNRNKPY